MVEDGEAEGLSLGVGSDVGLKAEGVDGRHEGLDGVEGRARHWGVVCDMTPSSGEHRVHG